MRPFNDLTGRQFGDWSVLQYAFNVGHVHYYLCQCKCGRYRPVSADSLQGGRSLSCGCRPRKCSPRPHAPDRAIDLTGREFGYLIVVERAENDRHGNAQWLCVCRCGKYITVGARSLKANKTISCGCKRKRRWFVFHGPRQTAHPLYHTWSLMRQRCYNTRSPAYRWYGARGISVCPEWCKSFWQFVSDMGPRPDGTSLDRIDVNGPYCMSNCRWADDVTQARNKRIPTKRQRDLFENLN